MIFFSKRLFAVICFSLMAFMGFTQQVDIFKMQDSTNAAEDKSKIEASPVLNTFFSTRMVNSHTTEITGTGSMDFRINHRFGSMKNGFYDMFGLDYASMRWGFDFGIAKNLMMGFGRSTYNKELEYCIKGLDMNISCLLYIGDMILRKQRRIFFPAYMFKKCN